MGPNDPLFLIVPVDNPNKVCITAGLKSGDSVTLQKLADKPEKTQLWAAAFQINTNGSTGIAVINSASGTPMSVTSQGNLQPLVMRPFSSFSGYPDGWDLTGTGTPWAFRLVSPQDNNWSWNDQFAKVTPGDRIVLHNDKNPNSVWRLASPDKL